MELVLLEFGLGLSEALWLIVFIAALVYWHIVAGDSNYELKDWWPPKNEI
ncbi:hypothetical protein HY993_01830 [Candidatus Micrarchaeota archaeon]|nr:hypothetical protein [Candidatus Micrarchaeota archaeon]